MSLRPALHGLRLRMAALPRDSEGAAVIEFGLLGTLMLALFIGLFQVATIMQNYNSLHSLGDDVGRYVTVQYQKGIPLSEADIQSQATSIALANPYFLHPDKLAVDTSEAASGITGAKKITLNLTYQSADFLQFFGTDGITLTYDKELFVPG